MADLAVEGRDDQLNVVTLEGRDDLDACAAAQLAGQDLVTLFLASSGCAIRLM